MTFAPVHTAQPARGEPVHTEEALADLIASDLWLIDIKDVCKVTSLSRSSIWRMCGAGTFPKPVSLGPARRAWRVGAVRAWLQSQG